MSALEDYGVTEVPSFSIGDCVSVNIDHPLAHRHVQGILDIPVGYVIEFRVLTYGIIKTVEVTQCLVEWDSSGISEKSWVECSQLLPVDLVADRVRAVLANLTGHPRSGGITALE